LNGSRTRGALVRMALPLRTANEANQTHSKSIPAAQAAGQV
jgi:hypothetical protein